MQGAGAASSAVGAYYGAQANKQSLSLQANLADINAGSARSLAGINLASARDTADINARMLESAAQATLLTGQREEQKSRIATANLKGTQRASMAANGIVLGEGTANQVLTSTDVLGEADANTLHANAVRAAWGYRTDSVNQTNQIMGRAVDQNNQLLDRASNQTNQALMSRSAAGAINPLLSAGTSLLGGAGSVASSWYQYKKAGA